MRWLLAGASGFLGQALKVRLASEGHDVVRLVRREPASAAEFRWDPDTGEVDPAAFSEVGAVVNLGGVPVAGGLWTTRRREQILSSRVNTTRTLARVLAERAATSGDGRQRMPIIAVADWLGAVQWAADTPHAEGAYNLTIPQPTTNAEFTDALARALHRPRVLAAPKFVLRAALGELAEQLAGDVHVVPQRLTDDGFRFGAPDVTSTIAAALSKD